MTDHKILLKDTDIFDEVDLDKNKGIDLNTIAYKSSKKIWWKCKKEGHTFQATCHHRSRGSGCPSCSKYSRIITLEKSLLFLKPQVAKWWHPIKNGETRPENVSAGSSTKYWFKCARGHEFESTTSNQSKKTIVCALCSGRVPSAVNNFEKKFPHLAKQWDYKKNLKEPNKYVGGSNYKVWWICIKGHSYKQAISQRTRQNQGCNICNANISKPQIRIYAEFKSIFKKVELSKIIKKLEIDIYIPDIKIGVEYDGKYFHSKRIQKDLEKNKKIENMGISLIRVREKNLDRIGETDILLKSNTLQKKDIDKILEKFKNFSSVLKYSRKINSYLKQKEFVNNKDFNKYILSLPFPIFEKSLAFTHKDLINTWDYKKNKNIMPEQFYASNHIKVWWICDKSNHSWKASISDRAYKKAGCRICNENNRVVRFLEINKKRKGIKKKDWPDRIKKIKEF
jgi:very-short-patch-repair endonuclease